MSLESTDILSAEQLARLLAVGASVRPPRRPDPPGEHDRCDDDLDTEAGPFKPGHVVDEFKIVEEIGRGGMCVVYKARQRGLKRQVALKALRPSLARNPAVARRFRRESVLAANLSHPNIVPIFSHGLDGASGPYFTMELVAGRSIGQRVADDGPMSRQAALGVAIAACDALRTAHRAGILHRDVTPRNIILEEDTARVRLLDFGIARDTTGSLTGVTHTGRSGAGTPAFMSPEQNLARPVDERTDIFSLGMTLYHMLTGSPAYRGANRAELALAFQMQKPRPPGAVRAAAAGALARIVMKMIAVDRDQRYRNCDELSAALAECRDQERKAGASKAESLARAAVAAALLATVALAAYALGPMACRTSTPPPHNVALGPRRPSASRPVTDPAPQTRPHTAPAHRAETKGPAETVPTTVRPEKPAGVPAIAHDPPSRPEPPQAVVSWVYQPDAGKTFDDPGALRGRTTLADDNAMSLGLYLFDPRRGLVQYGPLNGPKADFRVRIGSGRIGISRTGQPDGSGGLQLPAEDAFATASPPHGGYESFYQYTLRREMVLFFRCASGGHAKLCVASVK